MPHAAQLRVFFALVLLVICAGTNDAAESSSVRWSELRDVEGKPIALVDAKWKVVCFLGAECPLARLYGSRLESLGREFAGKAVQVVGINSNPQDSTTDVKRYIREHELSFPIVKDGDQSLARQLGATRTPEVFVLDATDKIRYQGRIDDQYEPGVSRAEPTKHDLRDAIEALVAGRPVAHEKTNAVGCLISISRQPQPPVDPAAVVTFTRCGSDLESTLCRVSSRR